METRVFTLLSSISMLAGIAAPSCFGQLADPLGTPKIQFATNIFDFGKVGVGEVVKATFYFTNVGTAPLEITDVRPGCGCTAAGAWDRRVEPGKSGSIPLQVNTSGFGGPITKTATVTCNDSATSTLMLQIKGEVWKPVDVTPTFVMFNITGPSASNEVRVVKVKNNTPQPLSINDAQSSNPAFKARVKEIAAGKEYEIEVELVSAPTNGSIQGIITAKTTATNAPVVSVTAMAMVQPPITAAPGQISLPPGPLVSATPVTISLYNRQTTGITLSDPKVSFTNVTVAVREIQPGRVFNVTFGFPAGFDLRPGQRGEFSVRTTHPQVPEFKVPIYQMPKPTPMSQGPAQRPVLVPPTQPVAPRIVPPSVRPQTRSATTPPLPPAAPSAPRPSGS